MLPRSVEGLKSIATYGQEQRKSLLYTIDYDNVGCQVSKGDIQKHTQRHYCILSIAQFVDKVTNLDFQIEFFMSTASETFRFFKCDELASRTSKDSISCPSLCIETKS